jgi:hypothetical protein
VPLAGWLLGIQIGLRDRPRFNWLILELIGIEFGFTSASAQPAA